MRNAHAAMSSVTKREPVCSAPPTAEEQRVFETFYSVSRAGAPFLSDGGGPFGFDIHCALMVDELIRSFDIDGIIETGSCVGDTTAYLAKAYPHLPVWSCELDPQRAAVAQYRTKLLNNATVEFGDSSELLPAVLSRFSRPLVYLDAHWGASWPIPRELALIQRAVVVLDDFDIGNQRFGFDTYDGVPCDRRLLSHIREPYGAFVPNLEFKYPYPCLQVGRRAGRCFVAVGMPHEGLSRNPKFRELESA